MLSRLICFEHSLISVSPQKIVPGIYMAQQAMISYGYMQIGSGASGWQNSMWKTTASISCIALIEVADMRHVPKLITGNLVSSSSSLRL